MPVIDFVPVSLAILSLGIGIIMLLVNSQNKKRYTCKTVAKVIEVQKKYDITRQADMFTPIFEYTIDNKKYKNSGVYSNRSKYAPGDIVEVYYDPKNPDKIHVTNQFKNTNLAGGMFLATGFFVLVVPSLLDNAISTSSPLNMFEEISVPHFMGFATVLCFLLSILLFSRLESITKKYRKRTKGKIIDIKRQGNSGNTQSLLNPIVEFEVNGEKVTAQVPEGKAYLFNVIRRNCWYLL